MLGIEVAVSTVAKYIPRRRKPPSPTWRAFLENHLRDLVAMTSSWRAQHARVPAFYLRYGAVRERIARLAASGVTT